MKTLYKFKALVKTKVRNENGIKDVIKKGSTFLTTENYGNTYKKYNRMFEFMGMEEAEVKERKVPVKGNDKNVFPVTISEEMTNAEIEKILSEMGAKFKKKSSKKDLLEAYEVRKEEIKLEEEEKVIEKATNKFKAMVDNRTLEQLIEFEGDLDKATDVKNIDKDVCGEYILEVLEAKQEEAKTKKEGNENGSEGSLNDSDTKAVIPAEDDLEACKEYIINCTTLEQIDALTYENEELVKLIEEKQVEIGNK